MAPPGAAVLRFEKFPKRPPLCGAAGGGCARPGAAGADGCSAGVAGAGRGGSIDAPAAGGGDGDGGGALVADVRYEASQRLLLVGEANFSFAAALGVGLGGDCASLTATSFESRDDLLAAYGAPLAARLATLEANLCGVHHSVSAKSLTSRFRQGSFDCVAFNFPLCGGTVAWAERDEVTSTSLPADPGRRAELLRIDHAERLRQAYDDLVTLLADFFEGAAYLLRPGGECHLRLTDQFATCTSHWAIDPLLCVTVAAPVHAHGGRVPTEVSTCATRAPSCSVWDARRRHRRCDYLPGVPGHLCPGRGWLRCLVVPTCWPTRLVRAVAGGLLL